MARVYVDVIDGDGELPIVRNVNLADIHDDYWDPWYGVAVRALRNGEAVESYYMDDPDPEGTSRWVYLVPVYSEQRWRVATCLYGPDEGRAIVVTDDSNAHEVCTLGALDDATAERIVREHNAALPA